MESVRPSSVRIRNLRRVSLVVVVVFSLFCFGGRSARGAIITAVSPQLTDVSLAIAAAVHGDTIRIPPGDVTWPSSLTVTKCLTIMGAGTNSTRITRFGPILVLEPSIDAPIRITGIHFSCGGQTSSTRSAIHFNRGKCLAFRIDHCRFDWGKRVIWCEAWSYGVIDHNLFINPDVAIAPSSLSSGEAEGGDLAWARPIVPGTTNTVCIEDNTFVWDAAMPADPNEILYGQNAGRATFRHNRVIATAMRSHPAAVFDAHGYDSSWGRGTIMYELYNNTIAIDNTYRFSNLRGGTHLWFNNTFTMVDSGTPDVIMLKDEGQAQNGVPVSKDWVTNSFFWNNTFNGAPVVPMISSESTSLVRLNRNYFNRAPQAGDPFFPYTPLVYPHPMVTSENQSSTNAIISVTPPTHTFGSVPAGSTNLVQLSVRNVGGAPLSGVATVTGPLSIIGPSTYSLPTGAVQTLVVRCIAPVSGSISGAVTFTGGGGALVSISGLVTPPPGVNSFTAREGQVTPPFTFDAADALFQTVTTIAPQDGGRVVFPFTVTTNGAYGVEVEVISPGEDANSFFVNIDAEPIAPDMIWDIPVSAGPASFLVTWRADPPTVGDTPRHLWRLTSGSHQLIIRGRESGTKLRRVTIRKFPETPAEFHVLSSSP